MSARRTKVTILDDSAEFEIRVVINGTEHDLTVNDASVLRQQLQDALDNWYVTDSRKRREG